MFLTATFIVIMIYVHHVLVMNTVYGRWSLLGEIPRLSSNKVNKKDIRHLIYYRISILDICSIISLLTHQHLYMQFLGSAHKSC